MEWCLRWEATLREEIDCIHDFRGVAVYSKKNWNFMIWWTIFKKVSHHARLCILHIKYLITSIFYLAYWSGKKIKKKKTQLILNQGNYLGGKESRNALFWSLSYKNVLLLDWTISNCFFIGQAHSNISNFNTIDQRLNSIWCKWPCFPWIHYPVLVKMCPT